jgi:hypothetical protein
MALKLARALDVDADEFRLVSACPPRCVGPGR